MDRHSNTFPLALLAIFTAIALLSALHPADYFTWILETFPALIGCAILVLTYGRFRFTNLLYVIILVHCSILFIGGHFTYAEEPFFAWLKEQFHWQRNNFDKVGHFAQGFVPALIARELFVRRGIVHGRGWTNTLSITISLAISLLYELLEWLVAVLSGSSADSFLATQGDIWDTQSDMLFALIGSLTAIIFFSSVQNRAMGRMANFGDKLSG